MRKEILSKIIAFGTIFIILVFINKFTNWFEEDYSKFTDHPLYKTGYDTGYKKGVEHGEAKIDNVIYQDRFIYQGKNLPHCALAEYPQPCTMAGAGGKEAIYLDYPF